MIDAPPRRIWQSSPLGRRFSSILGGLLLFATAVSSQPAVADIQTKGATDVASEIHCLALTLYFEARGEPDLGKKAVGHVVLNRVADRRFPDSVCGVVRQGGDKKRYRCQFSWYCDGQSDKPENRRAWQRAKALAQKVFWGYDEDPTDGALWYHADYVSPSWRRAFTKGPTIGQHIFYTETVKAEPRRTQQAAKGT